MAEVDIPLLPVKVEYMCDECEVGKMVPTNAAFLTNPMQHHHICNKCGHSITLPDRYPKITYRDVFADIKAQLEHIGCDNCPKNK